MTQLEAHALVRAFGDAYSLEQTANGGYLVKQKVVDADETTGARLTRQHIVGYGQLIEALVRAGIPVLVRDEVEAEEAAQAVLGPDATVHVTLAGEFTIGGRDGEQIVAQGRSWTEAFARMRVRAVEEIPPEPEPSFQVAVRHS